jgi:hypothetical protein
MGRKREKENIISIKSKAIIKKAVINLLIKKKELTNISVTDISNESKLSRTTFYRHYNNVYEVIKEIEHDSLNALEKAWIEAIKTSDPYISFFTELNSTIKKDEKIIKEVVINVPTYVLNDIKRIIYNNVSLKVSNSEESEQFIYLGIIANGVASLYLDYFLGYTKLSIEEISDYSIKIFKKLDAKL